MRDLDRAIIANPQPAKPINDVSNCRWACGIESINVPRRLDPGISNQKDQPQQDTSIFAAV